MFARTSICSAVLLVACVPEGVPITPVMRDGCAGAEERVTQLGCAGAKGSPGPDLAFGTFDDISYTQACIDLESTGLANLHTACIIRATNCAEVEDCAEDGYE